MTDFQCRCCGRAGRYPSWVAARYHVHRCEYCGVPHHIPGGEVISPPLQPVSAKGRLSPWFWRGHAPYVTGVFECEFAHGLRLRLLWSGAAWMWCGQRVDTSELVKWRGVW
jgi:hypothetical protein